MKCQNCGKSEVNFHYSSNVNGCVTEAHLCSECAAKSGYDMGDMFGSMGALFNADNMFEGFFPIVGGRSAFMPTPMPLFGYRMPFSYALQQRPESRSPDQSCDCNCGKPMTNSQTAEVDDEMRNRRELYTQMRAAAESEDFEKAAELRNKLRELEKNEGDQSASQ